MQDLSISKKFTLTNVIVTLLVLVIGYFILNKYKKRTNTPKSISPKLDIQKVKIILIC